MTTFIPKASKKRALHTCATTWMQTVENMSQLKLEQLFHKCDRKGTGFIDHDEFRDLCSGFGISGEDADMIFADLDHDGKNEKKNVESIVIVLSFMILKTSF